MGQPKQGKRKKKRAEPRTEARSISCPFCDGTGRVLELRSGDDVTVDKALGEIVRLQGRGTDVDQGTVCVGGHDMRVGDIAGHLTTEQLELPAKALVLSSWRIHDAGAVEWVTDWNLLAMLRNRLGMPETGDLGTQSAKSGEQA